MNTEPQPNEGNNNLPDTQQPQGAATPSQQPSSPAPTPLTTPAQPAVTPPVDQQPQSAGFSPVQPPKDTSKKKLVIILIVLAVVLLGGGAAAAYKFWYQNPEKVLGDSVMNLLTRKGSVANDGSLDYKSQEVNIDATLSGSGTRDLYGSTATIKFTPQQGAFKDKEFTLKGDAVYRQDGTAYVKASNVSALLDSYADLYVEQMVSTYKEFGVTYNESERKELRAQIVESMKPIVSKIDGQWIKISAKDLSGDDADAGKQYECVVNAANGVTDKSKLRELSNLYAKNKFVVIKKELGSKDGSLGYEIDFDKTKAKEFGKQAENTALIKAFNDCNKDKSTESESKTTDESIDKTKVTSFQVWVSRWSHQLTRVVYEAESTDAADKGTFKADLKLDYSKKAEVVEPKDAKSIKEVIESFESTGTDTSASV